MHHTYVEYMRGGGHGVTQMVNYGNSSGATIKLQKAGMPSVTARTKMPTFAPKYYG